jgi:16S rRNA (cytosine1402-N4)-methyltransferase
MLETDGRIAIITYHSLEDRIVKQLFKTESTDCICPPEFPICQCNHKATIKRLTGKPILPDRVEIRTNSRARSAKLRVAVKI